MGVCKVCGCNDGAAKDARSVPQIRRYFAIIRTVYDQWPERHPEQFEDAEAMRKWLQMSAGYREMVMNMPVAGIKPDLLVIMVTAAFRAVKSHARASIHKGRLIVWAPKSIAFASMPHREFCKLVEDVEAVIARETGIRVEELEGVSA